MKNKIYKMMINKWDVELCAKTLNVSRRRVEKYLNALMKTALPGTPFTEDVLGRCDHAEPDNQ